jgi:hypothetical protein
VGVKAQEQGLARIHLSYDELFNHAIKIIKRSRELTQTLMEMEHIAQAPED